ncbi:hypothetical protein ACHAXT_000508 [Thalassiosira profunda]
MGDGMTAEEVVDALNEGVVRSVQSSGQILPSTSVGASNFSPVQCEWTEYASELCCPAVEDLRQCFPPLDGDEVGSDGRPFLYAACLGLLLSPREEGASPGEKSPLSIFLSIASFLLDELEVDPDQPTETEGACHRPPLHLVARSGHPAAVHALLSRGADVNLRDEEGWTALMAVCLPDIPSCEEGGPTAEERIQTMRVLFEHDVDVDAQNYCGYSALHYACEGLNSSLIQCLLEDGGADATIRTIWGSTFIGIVQTRSHINVEEAAKCEAILVPHLERMDQMEEIRSFLEEERKAIDLMNFVEDVLLPAARRPADEDSGSLEAQDRRIVTALLEHLNLDPSGDMDDGNPYEVIHHRIMELIPVAYRQVYISQPSAEERQIITCANFSVRKAAEVSVDGARRIDTSLAMRELFIMHRERGRIAHQLELLTDLIVGPLQRTFAFGVPSNSVVRNIVERAPHILEMGAGTGYWSLVLSKMGADVEAYDSQPIEATDTNDESTEENGNLYFGGQSYYPVQKGDATIVFDGSIPQIADRALLLAWPNNPDAEDNPHVAVEGSTLPPVWDLECLQRYYELGGSTVIYVGERESEIELLPDAIGPDCGFCSSRKFQLFLHEHFVLEAELKCPQWWMKEDDVTIWKRK